MKFQKPKLKNQKRCKQLKKQNERLENQNTKRKQKRCVGHIADWMMTFVIISNQLFDMKQYWTSSSNQLCLFKSLQGDRRLGKSQLMNHKPASESEFFI